ncbi:hypothetical protein RugamoR64_56830 [Duganella rhizosphaerae]|uniref:histidine kinase n=1 Tax=Duganella rhizosphaerae TaxID=2885763 RepID=UPI0030E7B4CA
MPQSAAMPSLAKLYAWLPPFAAAALAWNLLALSGALASYGDAQQHGALHASFALTLLRFVAQHAPLVVLSLMLAVGFCRAQRRSPQLAQLLPAYLGMLALGVPLLCIWQSAINGIFSGKGLAAPLDLLRQQSALSWWFQTLLLTLAFCAHLAYSAWRHAHAQALAWQLAQQGNLALRLRLLQGQLEPYLLSGALAGIARLNRRGLREQATRALARLSDLLRYALRASRSDWQSVADEVRFLRDYVDLQRICRDAGLQVDWQLEAIDWSGYRCPPLLLLPMLEQALEAAPQRLTVRIGRRQTSAGSLVLVELSYPHGARVGKASVLAELEQRLAMQYGGAATLGMQADGDLTHLRLAYPVAHHDD